MTIHIGTSGWHYKSWLGAFYPSALPSDQMLSFYAEKFSTVEIDSSFYRLPTEATLRRWARETPPEFVFAFKASRYLTHWKKLIGAEEPLLRMLERAGLLRPKLGPVLFQLPPRWRINVERLRSFLALLPTGERFAFEFRDPSWFAPETYEALNAAEAAFCVYEFGDFRSPLQPTADFVYVRLHGPAGPYAGRYETAALSFWADALRTWEREGRETYCYFDNDERGYAADNARELKQILSPWAHLLTLT